MTTLDAHFEVAYMLFTKKTSRESKVTISVVNWLKSFYRIISSDLTLVGNTFHGFSCKLEVLICIKFFVGYSLNRISSNLYIIKFFFTCFFHTLMKNTQFRQLGVIRYIFNKLLLCSRIFWFLPAARIPKYGRLWLKDRYC